MADPDYFLMADFRLLPGMSDGTKYPDARVLAVAASLTSTIEREVGTSFVPRTVTETLTACDDDLLILGSLYVQSITTATLNGVSVSPSDLALDQGVLQYGNRTRWARGNRGNVVVTYVTGYPAGVPADLKEHLMLAVRDRLLATSATAGIDARRTSMVTEQGTVNYLQAGEGHPTGYPDLDAAIVGWRDKLNGPNVA